MSAALLLAAALTAAPFAPSMPSQSRGREGAVRPARAQIRIPVWVDGSGGLEAGDLTARAGGAASKVLAVRGPADDLVILAVLDLTGDVAYVEPAKEALIAGVSRLAPRAWVGLLRAQDGLRVLVDPTADREAVARAVREVPASGKAGLLDTVETAARIGDAMLARSGVRLAVLYLSDSDIENYRDDYTNPVINRSDSRDLSRRFPEALVKEKISRLEAALAARQSPLFIVHLRYYGNRLNEAYRDGLKRLAEVTGGTGIFCRSDAEIPGAVARALDSVAASYSVTVALPERHPDALQVQLEHGGGRSLNYRARFVVKGR